MIIIIINNNNKQWYKIVLQYTSCYRCIYTTSSTFFLSLGRARAYVFFYFKLSISANRFMIAFLLVSCTSPASMNSSTMMYTF